MGRVVSDGLLAFTICLIGLGCVIYYFRRAVMFIAIIYLHIVMYKWPMHAGSDISMYHGIFRRVELVLQHP